MTSSGVLVRGDALDFPSRLAVHPCWDGGPFDLVYVDPPFNVGGEFTARRGKGETRGRRKSASGVHAFRDAWGGVDGFLSMLEPRMAALRDGMRDTGTLWLHLDQRTVHDAKVLCDRVFGRGAFRGEIIWCPGNGARGHALPMTHQTILVYTRSADPGASYVYNRDDPALREPFADTSLAMHFKQSDEAGRRYRDRIINGKRYRYYADEGRARGSVWTDLPSMTANTPLRKEGTGYPTQKPLSLLERIVRAASRPGDLVVDPMCGSGTTLEAAARLGRRFAGGDLGDLAIELTSKRLESAGVPFELARDAGALSG
jgi:site-specific DNA-methyltransferase (adenine-specific)